MKTLRPFTKQDWAAFAGCESAFPWIAELDEEGTVLILDGTTLQMVADRDEFWTRTFPSVGDALNAVAAILAAEASFELGRSLLAEVTL